MHVAEQHADGYIFNFADDDDAGDHGLSHRQRHRQQGVVKLALSCLVLLDVLQPAIVVSACCLLCVTQTSNALGIESACGGDTQKGPFATAGCAHS